LANSMRKCSSWLRHVLTICRLTPARFASPKGC
jgi:hypothetical protein